MFGILYTFNNEQRFYATNSPPKKLIPLILGTAEANNGRL